MGGIQARQRKPAVKQLKKIGEYQFNNDITDKSSYLGGGAFGKVWKGYHIETKQQVAVKEIAANTLDQKTIEMEISAYKALADKFKDHKNLLRIYKIYRTKNSLYMIMELCTGGDLEAKMKNGRKVPEREAIKILRSTISGLAFMNKFNVFHRDIKPANIIIHDGVYKICDYGLAKVVGHNNKSFTLLGTPLY